MPTVRLWDVCQQTAATPERWAFYDVPCKVHLQLWLCQVTDSYWHLQDSGHTDERGYSRLPSNPLDKNILLAKSKRLSVERTLWQFMARPVLANKRGPGHEVALFDCDPPGTWTFVKAAD